MKKILSVMAAIGLSSISATNVVACNNNSATKIEPLNAKWAEALGWYDNNGETLMGQLLTLDKYEDTCGIMPDNNFMTSFRQLLTNKAPKNDDAKALLSDLGFKVGSDNNYSDSDANTINNKILVYPALNNSENKIGTISVKNDNSGFTITESTIIVKVLIMKNPVKYTILKSFKINLKASDLNVKIALSRAPSGLFNGNDATNFLTLDSSTNYQAGGPTSAFTLKFTDYSNAKLWDSLIKLLKGTVTLNWYSDQAGTSAITTFPAANTKTFLKIAISGVDVTNILDCGIVN